MLIFSLRSAAAVGAYGLLRGVGYMILAIIIGIAICVVFGYWAGRVAQGKGRSFAAFFVFAFVMGLCGIVPGLLVVIIAYMMQPAPGYYAGQSTPGSRRRAGGPGEGPGAPCVQPPKNLL